MSALPPENSQGLAVPESSSEACARESHECHSLWTAETGVGTNPSALSPGHVQSLRTPHVPAPRGTLDTGSCLRPGSCLGPAGPHPSGALCPRPAWGPGADDVINRGLLATVLPGMGPSDLVTHPGGSRVSGGCREEGRGPGLVGAALESPDRLRIRTPSGGAVGQVLPASLPRSIWLVLALQAVIGPPQVLRCGHRGHAVHKGGS